MTERREMKSKMCISTKDGEQIFACSECFTEVDGNDNFCPECGANIEKTIYGTVDN